MENKACLFILTLFFNVVYGQSCGDPGVGPNEIKNRRLKRITNGNEAKRHGWPFMAYIFCGGTLIDITGNSKETDLILTAAHCCPQEWAKLGAHAVDTKSEDIQLIYIENCTVHENYVRLNTVDNIMYPDYDFDVALIKLKRPVKFSKTVQPVCLPEPNQTPSDPHNCYLIGWGLTEKGTAEYLREVKVSVGPYVPSSLRTATNSSGRADDGDSGGPLMCKENNRWVQYGVISTTLERITFTPYVSYFKNWIETTGRLLTSVVA